MPTKPTEDGGSPPTAELETALRWLASTAEDQRGSVAFVDLFEVLAAIARKGLGLDPWALPESGEMGAARHAAARLAAAGRTNPVIFDVGANKGTWLSIAIEVFAEMMPVIHCFEPFVTNLALLSQHPVIQAGVATVHAIALGDTDGQRVIHSREDALEFTSFYPREFEASKCGKPDHVVLRPQGDVREARLDDFCTRHGIAAIDFLKIDVEGHERFVLEGAGTMLRDGRIRFIQFEFGGTQIDSRTYFRDFWDLLSRDYELRRIMSDGLLPIKQYDVALENFCKQDFLAEWRG